MGRDIFFEEEFCCALVSGSTTLIPVNIGVIAFDNSKNEAAKQFPYEIGSITLKATEGFESSIYNWEYQVGNSGWKKLPDNLQYANNKSEVTLKGADLFSQSEFEGYVKDGKSIIFRINTYTQEQRLDGKKVTLSLACTAPHIIETQVVQPTCHGYNDGAIRLRLSRALYEGEKIAVFINSNNREIDNFSSLEENNWITINNLAAGIDTVRIHGTFNGHKSYTNGIHERIVTIVDPAPVKFTALHSDVLCHGGSSGTITVSPTGGTGIYRIMLDGVKKANDVTGDYTITGLVARDSIYIVEVQDTNGCSHDAAKSITITQPTDPLSIINISLKEYEGAYHSSGYYTRFHTSGYHTHDGMIEVQVSGGKEPYTVYCTDDFNKIDSLVLENSGVLFFENLHRGNYSIKVRDANGCTAVQDTILKSPEELRVQIEQVTGIDCYGNSSGKLIANAIGGVEGYNFRWEKEGGKSEDNKHIEYLYAGRYRVVVTDGNGIKASAEYELTQPDSISIAFPVVAPPTCGNQHRGRIEAAVRGGTQPYSYDWSNGDTIAHASFAKGGSYTLYVIDANGCEAVNSIIVEAPGELSVSHTATAPTCYGLSDGRIELTVSGGMAPYTVRWADEMWNTPATLPALAQRGPNALCDEDSEVPDFTGSTLRTNLPAGRYEAVVTDAAGCEVAVSVVLEQPEPIALWLGPDLTLCSGARTLLSAQTNRQGLRYSWHTPWTFAPQAEPQLWVDAAGSYAVTATDSAGCMATDTVRVLQGSEPLPLDITAPSSAAARATVHAVNLSPDGVQHVRWILPTEAEVVRSNDAEAVFIMPRSGTYQIAFEARTDRCTATIGQPLEILDTLVLPGSDDVPLIQQFLLSPSGLQLAVRVELREASRMVLNLLTADGRLIDQHVQPSAKTHTHRFNLSGLPAGEYQVVLQVGGQVATMRYTKQE